MRMWWIVLVALMAAPAVAADQEAAPRLSLTCLGSIDQTSTKAGFFGPTKDHQQIPSQLDVEIAEGAGRVRLPSKLLPMLGRPSDGWSVIKSLRVNDDTIDGTIDIRSMSHPKLHIDRRSGSIAYDGILGKFFGSCRAMEPGQRAF